MVYQAALESLRGGTVKDRIRRAIETYNRWILDKGGRYCAKYSSPKTRETASKLIHWADKHHIQLDAYIEARIRQRAEHRCFVKFSDLQDDRWLQSWQPYWSFHARARMDAEITRAADATQPTHSLSHTRERFKSFYVHREHLCEAQITTSGGFHPQSLWCLRCPRVSSCIVDTNARYGDVIELRRAG
jgi:hypothetical protein